MTAAMIALILAVALPTSIISLLIGMILTGRWMDRKVLEGCQKVGQEFVNWKHLELPEMHKTMAKVAAVEMTERLQKICKKHEWKFIKKINFLGYQEPPEAWEFRCSICDKTRMVSPAHLTKDQTLQILRTAQWTLPLTTFEKHFKPKAIEAYRSLGLVRDEPVEKG